MHPSSGTVTSKQIEQEFLRDLLLWVVRKHFLKVLDDLHDNVFEKYYLLAKDSGWHPAQIRFFEKKMKEWQSAHGLPDDWITDRIKVIFDHWCQQPMLRTKRMISHMDNSFASVEIVSIDPPQGLYEFNIDSNSVEDYVESMEEMAFSEIKDVVEKSLSQFDGALGSLPLADRREVATAVGRVARKYAQRVVDANMATNNSLNKVRKNPQLENHYLWLLRARFRLSDPLETISIGEIGEAAGSHPGNVSRSISALEVRLGMVKDTRRKPGIRKGGQRRM